MRNIINVAVATVILLVGIGITVAFARRAREAGQVSQCKSNLRQIGVAVLNYAAANNSYLPPGTVPNNDLSPERRLSWMVGTFYFVECTKLKIDMTKAWDADEIEHPIDGETGEPAVNLGYVRIYVCPGNPKRPSPDWPGLTHYVGMAGLGEDAAERPLGYLGDHTGSGFFGYNRRITIGNIVDDRATTLMAIETEVENGPWTAGGRPTVRGLNIGDRPYLGSGRQFGGMHRGGTMAVFADGSARLIKDSIDPAVFEALVTIAGLEAVGPFDAD